jgi:muconate cycloisomerase
MLNQSPQASVTIADIEVRIVDIPLLRPHKLAMATISCQTNVVVRIKDQDGREGWGEAAAIPHYGVETVETISCVIGKILVPDLIGKSFSGGRNICQFMDKVLHGHPYAKSAVELAYLDLLSRARAQSIAEYLGGPERDRLPSLWVLGNGIAEKDIAEAEHLLHNRLFQCFLLKIGASHPDADIARVRQVADAIGDRAELRVDVNQKWDEVTALHNAPKLFDAGISVIEQPVPRSDVAAMSTLTAQSGGRIMADEPVETMTDALKFIGSRACSAVSLKVGKNGGAVRTAEIAAVFAGARIPIFGGTMLESSLGVAAHSQVFSTFENLDFGQQLFGPKLMAAEFVKNPVRFEEFNLIVPLGPGSGVDIDLDILRDMTRKN